MVRAVLLLGAVAVAAAAAARDVCGSCGQNCSGCDHGDTGSCGNACCRLDWTVGSDWKQVATTLNESLTAGGPDGAYTASKLAEGVTGCTDLSPFDNALVICQFHHTTAGPAHYNDSISLTVAPVAGGGSKVRLFSYSLIGGAYGDDGQNRKNLDMIVEAYGAAGDSQVVNVDESCP